MAVTISFADKFTFSVTLQNSFFLVTSFLVYFLTRYYLTSFSYPIKSIHPTPPSVSTSKAPSSAPSIKNKDKSKIDCYSPSTNTYLGSVSVLPPSSVEPLAALASSAQSSWATTSFEERRQVLRTIQHYITSNTELICKVSEPFWKTRNIFEPLLNKLYSQLHFRLISLGARSAARTLARRCSTR